MFQSGEGNDSQILPEGIDHRSAPCPIDGNSIPAEPKGKALEDPILPGVIVERGGSSGQEETTTSKRKRSEDSSAADEPSKKSKPTEDSCQTEELISKIHDAEEITMDASLKVQPWESTEIQALVKRTLTDFPVESIAEYFLPKPLQSLHQQICESSSLIAYVENLEKTVTQLREELDAARQNATTSTIDRQSEEKETGGNKTDQHKIIEIEKHGETEAREEEGSETTAEPKLDTPLDIQKVCVTRPIGRTYLGDTVLHLPTFELLY
jgi:hypothetical protein